MLGPISSLEMAGHLTSSRRLSVAALTCSLAACEAPTVDARVGAGDPAKGNNVVAAIECGAFYAIPGIPGANGIVGPSLAAFLYSLR